jgi:hypothetical protein
MGRRGGAMAALHIAGEEMRACSRHSQPAGEHCYHRNGYQPSHCLLSQEQLIAISLVSNET